MTEKIREFELLLGHAALRLWPEFPREVQERLFETAVPLDTKPLGSFPARPTPENCTSTQAYSMGLAVRRTQKSFTEMEHEHRGIKYFALFVLVEPNGTGERGSD
jgi:hypothetical protein